MAAIDKFYLKNWSEYTQLKNFFEACGTITDDYGNKITPISYLYKHTEEDFNKIVEEKTKSYQKLYDDGSVKKWVEEGWYSQEDYDNYNASDKVDVCVMNTPTVFDVWLIRNCPLDFIQSQLKDKYSGGWSKAAFTDHNDDDLYEQILNKTSIYDTYKRNGVGKNLKMSKCKLKKDTYHIKKVWFTFELELPDNEDEYWSYLDDEDYWRCEKELRATDGWTSSLAHINRDMSWKAVYRKLCKWNLPEGMKVHITRWYICRHTNKRYAEDFELIIKKK